MRSSRLCVLTVGIGLSLVACGGDEDAGKSDTRDGTADTSDGETGDASAADSDADGEDGVEVADSEDGGDAGDVQDGDRSAACSSGAEASGSAGADGVTLTLCGATLSVPGSALPAGAAVTLAIVEPPGPAPFEYAFSGHVFALSASDAFTSAATLQLPDSASEGGYREAARWSVQDARWLMFEACPDGAGVRLAVYAAGAHALLRHTVIYPDSTTGLGDGALTSVLGDAAPVTWDLDTGYAIHDQGESGLRTVTVIARRDVAGGVQQLDVRLSENEDHSFAAIQVALVDTTDPTGGATWLEPVHGPATHVGVAATAGGHIAGTITADLHQGDVVYGTMTVTLDVTTERYRFPPEASCFPEG